MRTNLSSLFLFQLFTTFYTQPIKSIFNGSVGFNITVQALGQRIILSFHVTSVMGKTNFGGKKIVFSFFSLMFFSLLLF